MSVQLCVILQIVPQKECLILAKSGQESKALALIEPVEIEISKFLSDTHSSVKETMSSFGLDTAEKMTGFTDKLLLATKW